MALSGLLAVGGHEVRARARAEQAGTQAQTQAPPSQASSGRPTPPNGQFPGRGLPPSVTSPISVDGGPGWDWWKDDAAKKEIGLRPDQANRIDSIYNRRVNEIDPTVKLYFKQHDLLDKMLADRVADETALAAELTTFFALSAEIRKTRVLMMFRIEKVLDADQFTKLKAIDERRRKEHSGRGGFPFPAPLALPR